MAYPFSNNPLDDYLKKLRGLRAEQHSLYQLLPTLDKKSLEKIEMLEELSRIQDKVKEEEKNCLPERSYDVFYSEDEVKIRAFYLENPEPIFRECDHSKSEPRIKVFSDNTKHIWLQCLGCGKGCGALKKSSEPGWSSYPAFDEVKEGNFNAKYFQWNYERTDFLISLSDSRDDIPSFNWEKFKNDFDRINPKPLHPSECSHEIRKVTIRSYKNGSKSAVEQCNNCGKHLKSLPKSSFGCVDDLDKFDEDLEGNLKSICSAWFRGYSEAMSVARQQFHEEISRQIALGVIFPVDSSRFGSYYGSVQWFKTRQRIFVRDDYLCQSCGVEAQCVHHILYERLGCENDLDLISLCNHCHDLVHLKQDEYPFSYRLSPAEIKMIGIK